MIPVLGDTDHVTSPEKLTIICGQKCYFKNSLYQLEPLYYACIGKFYELK